MSRIFLSLHPYFEDGKIMGRKEANKGFIKALFRKDPFEIYHFFVDNPHSLIQKWQEEPAAQPLLKRGALHAFPRTQLEKRVKIVPYSVCHLSDPMTEFAAMCRVRNAVAPKIFPITAVNHTISYVEYAEKTLGHVWAGCSARDGIGCTSRASEVIMQSWYGHAREAFSLPSTWVQPQTKVIPLGVPEPELKDNALLRQEFRSHLNLTPNTVLLLLYGRISIVDKMDVRPLFAALRRVRLHAPHLSFQLCIAGSMDDDDPIKEQILELAKAWDISLMLIPNPSRKIKKDLFAAADVFISPVDNIQETFGLTLIEAAQSALPVIASDWNGYKDIIVPEQTGLLIPTLAPEATPELDSMAGVYYNKIHQLFRAQQTALHVPSLEKALFRLISDEKLRKDMGQAAAARAAKLYTFDTVIDGWLEFWKELEDAPISQDEQARLRGVTHPYALAYGKVFTSYASASLQPATLLHCTSLGQACREKRAPWNNYGLASINVIEGLVHKLLAACAQGSTVAALLLQGQQGALGGKYSQETLLAHIYWLVKQDLVEITDL